MNLPAEKIAKLAARKGVKRTAVENFLSSLDGLSASEVFANLRQDARSYGWNAPTVNAISAGISAAQIADLKSPMGAIPGLERFYDGKVGP